VQTISLSPFSTLKCVDSKRMWEDLPNTINQQYTKQSYDAPTCNCKLPLESYLDRGTQTVKNCDGQFLSWTNWQKTILSTQHEQEVDNRGSRIGKHDIPVYDPSWTEGKICEIIITQNLLSKKTWLWKIERNLKLLNSATCLFWCTSVTPSAHGKRLV
jgi:hypothetical protein